MSTRRKDWENDILKKSNDVLYQLLDDCLKLFTKLKGNTAHIKALNADLKTLGITFNSGASLATRIARAVFGKDCENRAYAYARVISIAAEDKEKNVSMRDFIIERGGIEKIRRGENKNSDATELRNKRRKKTAKYLSKSKAIVSSVNLERSKTGRKKGGKNKFVVAILREENDGKFSVVFETDKAAVVNTALTAAGNALDVLAVGKSPNSPSEMNGASASSCNTNSATRVAPKLAFASASTTQKPEDLVS